jgi:hypothetical protein
MVAPAETGLSIITDAFLMAGITGQGVVPNSADQSLAFRRLNGMISQWNTQRWMIWHLLSLGFTSDGRTAPYTVGLGGNYNVARRPDRIEYAFVRQLVSGGLPVDTRLTVWESREQYDRATLKQNFISYPRGVFLDTAWPTGNLYVYPWPNAAIYQIFIDMKDVLPVFTAQTLAASIPDQYLECIKTNLARRLRQNYGRGMKPDAELNIQAKAALSIVKDSNLQTPELGMPAGVPGTTHGIYNIFSDNN